MVLRIPPSLTLMTALMPYDKLAVVVAATALGSQEEVTQLLGALRYAFYGVAIINGLGVAASALRGPNSSSGRAVKSTHAQSYWILPLTIRPFLPSFSVN